MGHHNARNDIYTESLDKTESSKKNQQHSRKFGGGGMSHKTYSRATKLAYIIKKNNKKL